MTTDKSRADALTNERETYSIEGTVRFKRSEADKQVCVCCPPGGGHVFSRRIEWDEWETGQPSHFGNGPDVLIGSKVTYRNRNEGRRVRVTVEVLGEVLAASPVEQPAAAPMNGIPASLRHDEGAIARCSYCGRYSLDPKTLSDRQPKCDCGEKHGWSGSFKKPAPDAKWSGEAPAPADERAAQELLPVDRKWVTAKAISLVAEYRNCKASEAEEVMRQFVGYMQAALEDAAARAASANETGAERAMDLLERAHLAAGQWANSNTPISEALAYRDGFIAGARAPAQAAEPVAWAVYWGIGSMRKNSVHFEKETAVKVAAEIKSNPTELRPLYAAPQPPAQADARVGLTDKQILALNTGEVFFSESPTKYPEAGHGTQYHAGAPGVLKFARAAIALAAHPGQPEPRAEVTEAACDVRRHWNPVYNTDPVQRACAELPEGWSISACMEREAGWVDVYGPDGKEPDFEGDSDHFDWMIHQAIDFAIDAARAGGAA